MRGGRGQRAVAVLRRDVLEATDAAQLLPAQPDAGERRRHRLDEDGVHELAVGELLQRQEP
ncbi:hypothetical protein, partial [Pseudonocardia benzenivorans]|uniref:hypothetical protein n=1 Tax=Pseudonocardia benzenivorans TaxID=228005 RepID=UPI0031F84889